MVINNNNTTTLVNRIASRIFQGSPFAPPVVVVSPPSIDGSYGPAAIEPGLVDVPVASATPAVPLATPVPVSDPAAPVAPPTPVPNTPVNANDAPTTIVATPTTDASITSRYIQVKNDSTESWTVWVEYYFVNDKGEGTWVAGDKALVREVKTGETTPVRDDKGVQVRARAIRIWAQSASGQKWEEYKEVVLDLGGEQFVSKNPTVVIALQPAQSLTKK